MVSRLLAAPLALALVASPAGAQQDADAQGDSPSLTLPVIGEVPLPDWLSFLATSDDGSNGEGGAGAGAQQAPPAVVFTEAEVRPVADSFTFMGQIAPIEQVAAQARISGFIEEVAFRGGQTVSQGDLLFQIERAQYEASLASAKAALQSARSQRLVAERDLNREQELRETNTVSEASLEDARARFEATRGDVLQAEAAVEQAELDLSYTSIEAPIDGQMSAPLATRGNFVGPTSGTIAELTQLDPIWGVFALNERRLVQWQRLGIGSNDTAPIIGSDAGSAENGAQSNRRISDEDYDLTLVLPDGSDYDSEGRFDFVGNVIDATTGTVQVRVRFDNPDGLLLPNQNVTLRVREADPPEYPVVPQSAVQLSRDGRAVWVVNDDDTVTRVDIRVEPGPETGTMAVTSGLDGGERVIVRGALRLQDGQTVDPRQAAETQIAGTGTQ